MLCQKRHELTLYLQHIHSEDVAYCRSHNIKVVEVPSNRLLRSASRWLGSKPDLLVGIDPHGLTLAGDLFPGRPLVYYSLELYMSYDSVGLDYSPALAERERKLVQTVSGLLIQSEEKLSLFEADHRINPSARRYILPICYRGSAKQPKTDHLRKKYTIAPDKRILVHLGGIAEWFASEKLTKLIANMPEWHLVFHGRFDQSYREHLSELIETMGIRNVSLSDSFGIDLGAFDPILGSADAGIAWYENISVGFRTAGQSSGKIPAYFRFGLPTIAKRYPSTEAAVAIPGCGVCIDSLNDLPSALSNILSHLEMTRERCWREYSAKYQFELYEDSLDRFLVECSN